MTLYFPVSFKQISRFLTPTIGLKTDRLRAGQDFETKPSKNQQIPSGTVDLYGKLAGKYTSHMDGPWVLVFSKLG